HHAGRNPLLGQLFLSLQSQTDFRAGCHDDGARILRITQHVATTTDVLDGLRIALDERQILARQEQGARTTVLYVHTDAGRTLDRASPGHRRFRGVARTPDMQVGDQTQAVGVLDGLVCRTVFAQTDGVVGEYVHN